MTPRLILKPGKTKPLHAHHPWIFSGAIARVEDASPGATIDIYDSAGRFCARGYYNPHSQIAARVWTFDDVPIDRAFFRARLQRASAARAARLDHTTTNAFRLVNAESDGLPGVIVDRYADFLVTQFLTLGAEARKAELVDALWEQRAHWGIRGIFERSDVDVREKEGLGASCGILRGDAPPPWVEIREHARRFYVDIQRGHKTGFYLDQRENRAHIAARCQSLGAIHVLNAFAYTGGFAVSIGAANPHAHIVNLDTSRDALNLARENMRLNDCAERGEFIEGDAFHVLRRYRDQAQTFDVIILDPPKFVFTHAQLPAGLRGYKDINLLAFKLLKPGGILVTFSCSGHVSAAQFQQVVSQAAADASRDAHILAKLSQASDHPILLAFPESEYLKGLVCQAQ